MSLLMEYVVVIQTEISVQMIQTVSDDEVAELVIAIGKEMVVMDQNFT